MCAAGLNLKAAEGDNVTIPFKNAGLERAERVTITLTRENQKTVIARYCRCAHCGDCSVVKKQGFLLRAEEGILTLLDVSSSNSGLYEAKIIADNKLSKTNATLDVNSRCITIICLAVMFQNRECEENNTHGHDCASIVTKIKLLLFLLEL